MADAKNEQNQENQNADSIWIYEYWEEKVTFTNRFLFRLGIILAQIVIIFAIAAFVRNSRFLLYIFVAISFLPPLIAIFLSRNKGFLVSSLGILIITQHLVNSLAQPSYAYAWGSDAMNDLHVARVLSTTDFFELGQVGYTERSHDLSFYLYPHLFLVIFSNIVGLDLYFTANFIIPVINGILVSYGLFTLYGIMFNSSSIEQSLGVIIYATCFYFDFFQSFFVRETFAFPIGLIFLGLVIKYSKIYKERPFLEKSVSRKSSSEKRILDKDLDKDEISENAKENNDEDYDKNYDKYQAVSADDNSADDNRTEDNHNSHNNCTHNNHTPHANHTKSSILFVIILGLGVIVSHHFTSYLILLILISLSLYSIFTRVKDSHIYFITSIFALILVVWIANVTITLALQQGYATWASVQSVLMGTRSGSSGSTIMADSYIWEKNLTYLYYAIFFIFASYGFIVIIRKFQGSYTRFFVILCIALLLFSTAARLTTSDKWTYNLAVRAMSWLYIGSAPLVAFSICRFSNMNHMAYTDSMNRVSQTMQPKHLKEKHIKNRAYVIFVVSLVLILSFGYFAQYYPGVKTKAGSVEERLSNPYFNYRAAIWLDSHSQNGSLLLYDKNNTELCYSLEPYSNTVLFHHEHYYTNFEGYIPIYAGGEENGFQNLKEVDTIYDNGYVKIVYTQGNLAG